ncbi:MAG TPA: peptidylprolyl isomerase [Geobacterales bacterium]|nr:peptidylprolyl isomerase [Geobacterales bacterium]
MAQAGQGDRVRVHYTGRLDDGEIFDSSECREDGCDCGAEPLEFVIGEGNVIPGFEAAVLGMALGERKEVHIPMAQAYGQRQEELVAVVERSELPPDLTPEVGMSLQVNQEDGSTFPVIITSVSDTEVVLDANHPLAGRDLTFTIELVEIV